MMKYIIHVKTQKEFDTLMSLLETKGYRWSSQDFPTSTRTRGYFDNHERCCVCLYDDGSLSYSSYEHFQSNYNMPIISFNKYQELHGFRISLNEKAVNAIKRLM